MTTRDFSDSKPTEPSPGRSLPKINLLTMFRLGLFQMGLGMLSLLTLGVLNRVMIDELRIPAILVGATLAMYQFVSPVRVWFGQISDAKPIRGYHRTVYVWSGLFLAAVILFVAVQVVWQLAASVASGDGSWSVQTYGWAALLALIFALYGVAISSCSTPFAALLVDVSDEDNRSKLVGVVWSMLMVGIVIGAAVGQKLLEGQTADTLQTAVTRLFIIFAIAVVLMGFIATVGVEKKYSRYHLRSHLAEREDQITLARAWQVLTASPQTGLFFTFLLVMTIGLFLQQPVLEPYAGEVFGMSVAESAGLNKYWGIGILLGISITGFLLVPRMGKHRATRLGCMATAICFALVIGSGVIENVNLLLTAVFIFGIASGILTNGAISLMLDLTAAETAGTFIGAWGLSQALAQAIATVTGGALLDLGRWLFATPLLAYSLVFFLEALAMLLALWLLSRVNVREFQRDTQKTISTVLEGELE